MIWFDILFHLFSFRRDVMFSVMLCFFDLFCRFTRSFLVLAGDRDVTLKVLKRGSSISSNIAHLEVC